MSTSGRWRLSPERYRVVCMFALALLGIIVVSGAAVRLTGSGLGCTDWPNCNNERLIDVSSTHAAIEQINRLFTGLVALGVVLAVLGSLRRNPRRRDLTLLSWGLVAGVVAQVILGGITVLVDLHPAAVQGHFLLSMVLIANAVSLVYRAGLPERRRVPRVALDVRRHVWAVAVATSVAIVLGTIVTGSGPHAGDEKARRFGFDIGRTVQVHSISVWITVALVVALMWRLRHRPAERAVLDGPLVGWISVAFLQGAVGYLQYFTGIPPAIVGIHIALATILFGLTVWIVESMRTSPSLLVDGAVAGLRLDASVDERLDELGRLVDDGAEEVAHVGDEVPERSG